LFYALKVLKNHFKETGQIVSDDVLASRIQWAKSRLTRLKDLTLPEFSFLWVAPTQITYEGPITADTLLGVLRNLESLPKAVEHFTSAEVSKSLRQFSKSVGIKFPVLMKCLRSILSGLDDGPPVGEIIQLLGRDETMQRIKFAQDVMEKRNKKFQKKEM